MPGVFGGVGVDEYARSTLKNGFQRAWGHIQLLESERSFLGGHAFRGSPLREAGVGAWSARDGELSCYEPLDRWTWPGDAIAIRVGMQGDRVEINSDASGIFPLYYATQEGSLVFSTLLKPLAAALRASPDPVAVAEFLRFAYTLNHRSLFEGISRLGPGQRIIWSPCDGLRIEDMSSLWIGPNLAVRSSNEAAEELAPLLRDAIRSSLSVRGFNVLMMSAGWDSRTLLGGAVEWMPQAMLRAFSHGDLESRELRLASKLAQQCDVPWTNRLVCADSWAPEHLDQLFIRTESLVFPHWGWAGKANQDAAVVFSGVLGEVLGGHYGGIFMASGVRKIGALVEGLRTSAVDDEGEGDKEALETAYARFSVTELDRPWYLQPDVEAIGELREAFNADVLADLRVLVKRGVRSATRLLEAFTTQHRGVQYIAAQCLSARSHVDAAIPFAKPRLLEAATRIPVALKIHNRVNRALGRRLLPTLSRLPMAATLVPASWPLLLQETSRVVRRGYEDARWSLFCRTRGRIERPHLGWVDFEFLRDGRLLERIANELHLDLWNQDAFREWSRRIRSFEFRGGLHPFFDQVGKILTVDRMLGP